MPEPVVVVTVTLSTIDPSSCRGEPRVCVGSFGGACGSDDDDGALCAVDFTVALGLCE